MTEDFLNKLSSGITSILNEELGKRVAICITLPRDISWEDYKKELETVASGEEEMLFRIPGVPKKVREGDRCYVCHRGYIIGWMTITGIVDSLGGFTCSTTGVQWPPGVYLKRSGEFHYLKNKVQIAPFRGFKYIDVID